MKTEGGQERAELWIQGVMALAVVVGLALVIWELREARALTQAQIIQDRWNDINQGNYALFGEQGATVLAAACLDNELDPAQKVVLYAFFQTNMNRVDSAKALLTATGIDNGWERILSGAMNYVARYPEGVRWLNAYYSPDPEIAAAIAKRLPSLLDPNAPPNLCPK